VIFFHIIYPILAISLFGVVINESLELISARKEMLEKRRVRYYCSRLFSGRDNFKASYQFMTDRQVEADEQYLADVIDFIDQQLTLYNCDILDFEKISKKNSGNLASYIYGI
jgi:hypothetical protein